MKKSIIAIAIGLIIVALIITFGQVFTVRYVSVEFENAVVSTDKQEILSLANININTNIFVLNEKRLETEIESGYDDSIIDVMNIVRKFPNKVVIKVQERIGLFKIKAQTPNESGYVIADRNFRRTKIYTAANLEGENLISVQGFEVVNTYDKDECYALKYIANAFIACGFTEESLPYLIESIVFEDNSININFRASDTVFRINFRTADTDFKHNGSQIIGEQIKEEYKNYSATDISERNKQIFLP